MQDNQMVLAMAASPLARWTEDQKALIKRQVAVGATDDELSMFLAFCADQGFNPLTKDVYFVKRQSKNGASVAYQTSIDAMRSRAEETGKYAGNDKPIYSYNDKNELIHAKVTVWKMVEGQRCAFEGEADWDEFYPGDAQGFMWKKMPKVMLGKCAEAQALRKAFPKQLKKVYVNEEMAQADKIEVVEARSSNEQLTAQLQAGNQPIEVIEESPLVVSDSNPGDYIIKLNGRLNGKAIRDVPRLQLESDITFWASKTRKPETVEFLDNARAFLAGR